MTDKGGSQPQGKESGAKNKSIKRQFVADGVFKAELNQFFLRAIAADGYSGLEVTVNNMKTFIKISVTKYKDFVGENGRKLQELTSLIQKRFGYNDSNNKVELHVRSITNRSLSAQAQAEAIKHKILGGFPIRVVAHSALRTIMREAKGVEIAISGCLRGQRAKTQKYRAGVRVSTGQPKIDYIVKAVRHVELAKGIVGVRLKIMLPHDPTGQVGPQKPLPDIIKIKPPKTE